MKKPTNPKDAIGIGKAPLSCVPAGALLQMGNVMFLGARKYGRHNWRDAGVRSSVYYDAMMRHLMDWWEGSNEDHESGMHPLAHVMACCSIVIDSLGLDGYNDDRPAPTLGENWISELNEKALEIIRNHGKKEGAEEAV
jgi:hypothetical protein